ncbi:nucleotide exchange factor GrpE [Marinifilum sp. D714]|uniref:nucleotide exchange factor GrpE n=1 Tax=Marinifilum sp. D714 TaxID=2937523 RepID=UPI0027CB88C3|nr:nucleotide exchange factor GrpE [Marinifilum sp. D714]MDQ2177420.1 nucleotide exchange factor GrpE [Marinifilum sp. D714]
MTKDTSKSKKEELEEKDLETKVEQPVEEKEVKEEPKAEKKEKKKSAKEKKADEIEELGAKLQDINDKYMRLSAEFDNYRKRTLKEKMELTKSAGEKILVNVLPVMDNFERALQSIDEAKDVEAVKEGVHLIYNNFKDFILQNGVKEIEAINKEFDTDIHEAITKIPAPSEDMKGKVVDCVEKGYTLNEKVIRFSKVVVGE